MTCQQCINQCINTANYQEGLLKRLQKPGDAKEYLNEALEEESQEVFMMTLSSPSIYFESITADPFLYKTPVSHPGIPRRYWNRLKTDP